MKLSADTPQILVSSKLMQQYRVFTPVSAATQIAAVPDRAGNLQLFTLGNDGYLYNLWQDPASDTGWQIAPMNFDWQLAQTEGNPSAWFRSQIFQMTSLGEPATIGEFAVANLPSGNIAIVARTADFKVWYTTDQRWSPGWQLMYDPETTRDWAKPDPTLCAAGFFAGALATLGVNSGTIYLFSPAYGPGEPGFGYSQVNGNSLAFANLEDSGPGMLFAGTDRGLQQGLQWIDSSQLSTSTLVSGSFSGLATTANGEGFTEIFLISEDDNSLNYIQRTAPNTFSLVKLSGSTPVAQITASRNYQGFLEVFALDADGSLYHTRQAPDLVQPSGTNPDPDAASGWTRLALLNPVHQQLTLEFSHFTAARNKDGYSQVFAVSTTDDLYQIWQDAATSNWNFEAIDVPDYNASQPAVPAEIPSYMTEISVVDALGVVRPNTTVTLWTSDETTAVVNGRNCRLDAVDPYRCSANAAGKVTVIAEAGALNASMLKVTTDFMQADEFIEIEPNAYIQDTLLTVTADGLTNATNLFSGQPVQVLQSDTPPDAIAAVVSGVNQCMSLTGAPVDGSDPSRRKYLGRNRNLRGLRYSASGSGKFRHAIDLSTVKEQHWRFTFDHKEKHHRFEILTREEAQSLLVARRAHQPASILDDWFDVDWGEVWDEITNIADIVVSTVVDTVTNIVTAISAQITLIIEGITYLYEQAVDLVEQVFDAVEGLFESIGAFFSDMFQWLGFLFSWNDILLTQKALRGLIADASLPVARQVFQADGPLNRSIDDGIEGFRNDLNTYFNDFLNSSAVGGANSTMLSVQQTLPPSDAEEQTAGCNIALSGLMDNVDSVEYANPERIRAAWKKKFGDPNNPFDALLATLGTEIPNFFSDPAFSQAVSYFQAIGDNPDQFLQNALGGILSMVQGIASAGLKVAEALVDAIFQVISTLFDTLHDVLLEELYVPLASELFTMVTGLPQMTILDLFALIAAIPVTIVYKLVFNAAPFADQAAVDKFVHDTLTAMRQGLGLDAAKSDDVPFQGLANFLAIVQAMGFLVYAPIEGILDIWPVAPASGASSEEGGLLPGPNYTDPPSILGWGAVLCEWYLWTASVPITSLAPPSCQGAAGIGTMAWLINGLTPFLDSAWLIGTSANEALKAEGGTQGAIMRNAGNISTAMDLIVSMGEFCMLAWVTAEQVREGSINVGATVGGFFAAVPGLFKFLRLPPANRWEQALLILGALDMAGDGGAMLGALFSLSPGPQLAARATA